MLAADVVNQLQTKLPQLVGDFTDNLSVTSLTRSGTTVTLTTSAVHGQIVGNNIVVGGAKTPIAVTSFTRAGIVGTIVTTTNHDATLGVPVQVEITGATESEFNGSFTIVAVRNRRTIDVVMDDSGPTAATGTVLALNIESALNQYNGRFNIDAVPTTTTIEYDIGTSVPFSPASGTITAASNPKISSAVNLDRVLQAYTEQAQGKAWMFVVLEDVFASKDRHIMSDATDNIQRHQYYRQQLIQPVSLYVILPTDDEISGRATRDRVEELLRPICQSILFSRFDSQLASGKYNALQFNSHGFAVYNKGYYAHRYSFEQVAELTFEDTVGFDEDVAFRDIDLTQNLDLGTGLMSTSIDLDDELLP